MPDPNFHGLLSVNVVATDQDGASSPVYGFDLSVYGVNDAPIVKDVAISPAVPAIINDLTLSFLTEDIDGDNVIASVAWYKNGVLESSQTGLTVLAAATACDEEWHAVVTPNDGTVDGVSYTSNTCLLYTSPSPRDQRGSRMPSSA